MISAITHQYHSCNRRTAISFLFADSDPSLEHFFFDSSGVSLNFKERKTTLRVARHHFDRATVTLIRLALDVWCDSSSTPAREVLVNFDSRQIENVTVIFVALDAAKGCGCQNCRQRFSPEASGKAR